MPSTDNGLDIFMRVHNSATMVARAGDTNAGSVRFTSLTIENSADANYRQPFEITFSDVAGVANYSIDGGPATPYVAGEKLTVNGMGLVLTGTPVAGDTVKVGAGADSQTDLFASLRDAIEVLKNPVVGDVGSAKLRNTLNSVTNELSNNLENVLTVRASVGARLNELDIVDSVSDNRALNYKSSISQLLDLDYNQAMSEYSLKMIGLQAAQKTFVDVQKLSLFNHI
jgi:flagellar hook-associated protein 3 FlgL